MLIPVVNQTPLNLFGMGMSHGSTMVPSAEIYDRNVSAKLARLHSACGDAQGPRMGWRNTALWKIGYAHRPKKTHIQQEFIYIILYYIYDICIIMYIFVHMYGSASNSSSCRFFCWPPCTAIPTGPNTCTEVVPSCPANFTFRTTTVGGGDFDDMVMVHEGVMWKV